MSDALRTYMLETLRLWLIGHGDNLEPTLVLVPDDWVEIFADCMRQYGYDTHVTVEARDNLGLPDGVMSGERMSILPPRATAYCRARQDVEAIFQDAPPLL